MRKAIYNLCSRHSDWNPLIFFIASLPRLFPSFNLLPAFDHLGSSGLFREACCCKRINNLTSAFLCVCPLIDHCQSLLPNHLPETPGSTVMTQFIINKRTDAWNTDVNLLTITRGNLEELQLCVLARRRTNKRSFRKRWHYMIILWFPCPSFQQTQVFKFSVDVEHLLRFRCETCVDRALVAV